VSRLELLAAEVELDPDELRALLRRLIAERVRTQAGAGYVSARERLTCATCGTSFELAAGRDRARERANEVPLCPGCRRPDTFDPGPREARWVASLDPVVLESALAAAGALA